MTTIEQERAEHYGRTMADGAWKKASPSKRARPPRPSTRSIGFEGGNVLDDDDGTATEAERKRAVKAVRRAYCRRWAELQGMAPSNAARRE